MVTRRIIRNVCLPEMRPRASALTSSQVRSLLQIGSVSIFLFLIVVFLDNRFRVLPQSIHDHLPIHHEGLVVTDIHIKACSRLNPFSNCQLDPERWHRIRKDLYLGGSWGEAYIHTQRKREEELTPDDSVVVDVRVSRLDPNAEATKKTSEKWESRPNGLWILRSHKRHESDNGHAVTAVDVLFGADSTDPRPGWTKNQIPLMLENLGDGTEAHLTVRHGQPHKTEKPVPRIRKDGRFKIMQLADLHLATGLGVCRDAEPHEHNGGKCEADHRTMDFVRRLLDDEEPDLVVLSGDQVNGDTAPDAQSAIFKFADVLINRPNPIPYAAIFGNHDDEKTMSRTAQMSLLQSLPYSLSEAGPASVAGVGNYFVEILAAHSHHPALTLYFLDTHSYSPDERTYHGYDWLKDDQIKWFKDTSRSLKAAHKRYAKIHMNMAFIHIPLPEYRDTANRYLGEWREGVTAPNFNSHFRDALVEEKVLAVSCGHDHVNSYCALSSSPESSKPELWMCYGGGAGFGGYGGYGGYHRRIRLFEVDMNEARITTWKRMEYGDLKEQVDRQIIVDGGRVVDL